MAANSQWPKWWQWPNVLALDASLVGVGWLIALAQANGVQIGIAPAVVLGLSIWLVYIADRWLDVRKLPLAQLPTVRHQFIKRWAMPFFVLWLIILITDLFLAIRSLDRIQILSGLIVVFLALIHTVLSQIQTRLSIPKEARISLIYMAGVGTFLSNEPALWPGILVPLGLFGLLCFINCSMIAAKEIEFDATMGRQSIANSSGLQIFQFQIIALFVLFVGLFLPESLIETDGPVAGAAIGLTIIGIQEYNIKPELFRVLADAILLVPWLFLFNVHA
ncbi:hypothetical protein [Rubellicoccus peritrichatus]|uniref:Uncharacterized protein n=1 Tax=Rubellicoccus peritrichatus TaxID=3080537 RepID=A0AAQ3LA11_9BACT|nr:hypothetical protein [Puniceicoccus sp. CR14]WOO42404.1 hypothetical protein RZN69_04830 [Puniceicoccus sp. CR14]